MKMTVITHTIACIAVTGAAASLCAAGDEHQPARFAPPTPIAALEGMQCLVVTPNGQHALISQDRDRSIAVIDLTDGHTTATFQDKTNGGWVGGFSPDSSKLAYWADAERVVVREIPGGRKLATVARGDLWPTRICFSSASDAIAIAGAAKISVVTLATLARTTIESGQWRPSSVAFSPDDHTLASCSISGRSRVTLFDLRENGVRRDLIKTATDTGELITYSPLDHPGYFVSLKFSPDGTRLVAASETIGNASKLTQWSTKTGALIRSDRIEGMKFGVCFLEPRGTWIVAVGGQLADRRWVPALGLIDSETGKVLDVARRDADELYGVGVATQGKVWRLFTTELSEGRPPHTYSWQLQSPAE